MLVATTVVEVGVDVPNATVMVICDADRFGDLPAAPAPRPDRPRGASRRLPAAHRGAAGQPGAGTADAVAGTRDGFELAEIDLEQRREGDVLGASQSGSRSSLRAAAGARRRRPDRRRPHPRRALHRADPALSDASLADIVTDMEMDAAGDWLERT